MYENWKQMQPILDATFERLTSYCYYFYHQTFLSALLFLAFFRGLCRQ